MIEATNVVSERGLPSGRSVILKIADGREELVVRSPQGAVEVEIVLTDTGPVVRLRGARLEVDADDVAVACRRFAVHTTEATTLTSDGELRVRTEDDIHLNGKLIRLNCTEAS